MSTTAQSVPHWGPQLGFEYLSDCGLCHTCNFVVRGNRVVSSAAAAVAAREPRQPALKQLREICCSVCIWSLSRRLENVLLLLDVVLVVPPGNC